MEKLPLAIIVDSTGVDMHLLNEFQNIYLQPLSINFGSKSYIDIIEMKPEDFYNELTSNPVHPTTSQPAVGAIVDQLNLLLEKYENIICLSVSSDISGTYSGFSSAIQMTSPDRIRVFDTKSCGPGIWIAAEYADSLSKFGKSFVEICDTIAFYLTNIEVFVYIDTLTYLAKSGRLSGATALIGNLIQMKTNIKFQDGRPVVIDRIRTAKKAMFTMVDNALAQTTSATKNLYVGYASANRPPVLDDVIKYIHERRPDLDLREIIIPAVLGNNSGPGAIGICFVRDL